MVFLYIHRFALTLIALLLLLYSFSVADELEATYSNESELGVVITSGNSDVSTFNFKQNSRWLSPGESYLFKARYLLASNSGIQEALQWGAGLRYEREMKNDVGLYLGQSVEGNIYQAILQRYFSDLGGKYHFYRTDSLNGSVETGYRFMRENALMGFKNYHMIRISSEWEKRWTTLASLKLDLEYLPNVTRWSAYLMGLGLSFSSSFSSVFSMKTSFEYRYYNEPPVGAQSGLDRIFTTSLVAKF